MIEMLKNLALQYLATAAAAALLAALSGGTTTFAGAFQGLLGGGGGNMFSAVVSGSQLNLTGARGSVIDDRTNGN